MSSWPGEEEYDDTFDIYDDHDCPYCMTHCAGWVTGEACSYSCLNCCCVHKTPEEQKVCDTEHLSTNQGFKFWLR